MQSVFLTGPMGWGPVLDVVLGASGPVESQPVHLDDAALSDIDQCFVPLAPVAGASVGGHKVQLPDGDGYARLCYFAEVVGLTPVPRHVAYEDGTIGASVAFLAPDPGTWQGVDWDQPGWAHRWGAVAIRAAQEIMGYYGRLTPKELGWRMPMILARAAAQVDAAENPAPVTIRSDTAIDAVQVAACTAPHEGFFRTHVLQLSYPQFDGTRSPVLQREVFVASDAIIVLPYDPVRDRVLLVEQFRMGPYGRGDRHPWVLEPVAGRLDAGETREDAARRECKEEAGLTLHGLEHASSHYFSPGCSTEYYHCFVGLADLPDDAAGFGGLETEQEDIRTHILPFDTTRDLIMTGEANIGPLVLLLLWLERERDRLRGG